MFLIIGASIIVGVIILINVLNFVAKQQVISKVISFRERILGYYAETGKFSNSNGDILNLEITRLKTILMSLDRILAEKFVIEEAQKNLELNESEYLEIKKNVAEKKKRWDIYRDFRENLGFTISNLENTVERLKQKAEKTAFGRELNRQEIMDLVSETVSELQKLKGDYAENGKIPFAKFNFLELDELEARNMELDEVVYNVFSALNMFEKNIEVYITELTRKSVFYLGLEQEMDSRKRERIGEITVSYKTFAQSEEGKAYKKETYVAHKRIFREQKLIMKMTVDNTEHVFEQDLDDQEFEKLFLCSDIKADMTKLSADGIPYELYATDLHIPVMKKGARSLKPEIMFEYYNGKSVGFFTKLFKLLFPAK